MPYILKYLKHNETYQFHHLNECVLHVDFYIIAINHDMVNRHSDYGSIK